MNKSAYRHLCSGIAAYLGALTLVAYLIGSGVSITTTFWGVAAWLSLSCLITAGIDLSWGDAYLHVAVLIVAMFIAVTVIGLTTSPTPQLFIGFAIINLGCLTAAAGAYELRGWIADRIQAHENAHSTFVVHHTS